MIASEEGAVVLGVSEPEEGSVFSATSARWALNDALAASAAAPLRACVRERLAPSSASVEKVFSLENVRDSYTECTVEAYLWG